ncbi:MAG: uroporphyrinogen decarboxylase [Chitinophagales bacterium]|nr:uroporphyrinogen decarboxylase [Bacteroidota bacterium]MCB9043771.1 uroporphyrinogen decarboxylase [Chitinophagales bacterium]
MKNDLILRAMRGENVERPPVWIMRQAGRVLPQYRAVRNSVAGFKDLLKNPELACEVSIQPVDILGVDAAIIFSDILVVPEAMGFGYDMIEKKGPTFKKTLQSEADVAQLQIAPSGSIDYTIAAIKLTKAALNARVPLIGFAGAPFTIFCYMVEGGGSKTFSKARAMMYQNPALAHQILQAITQSTINYLQDQIQAGVDILQIFDSWAGISGEYIYNTFSIPYLQQISVAVGDKVPLTIFAKDAFFALEKIASIQHCATVGLDWTVSADYAKRRTNGKCLQGNLDPAQLYAPVAEIEKATRKMLQDFGKTKYVANLGHGLYPDLPLDNVKCFVETIQSYAY